MLNGTMDFEDLIKVPKSIDLQIWRLSMWAWSNCTCLLNVGLEVRDGVGQRFEEAQKDCHW